MSLPGWLAEPAGRLDAMLEGERAPHAVLIDGPGGWGESLLASHFVLRLLGEERRTDARALAHPDLPPIGTLVVSALHGWGIDALRERLALDLFGERPPAPALAASS